MVEYKCFECRKTVSQESVLRRVRCPYCSCRMILKTRPALRKLVKAR